MSRVAQNSIPSLRSTDNADRNAPLKSDPVAHAAFRSVFDLAPVPMMITDGAGQIEYTNDALHELLGHTLEDLKDPSTIVTHVDDLHLNVEIRNLLRTGSHDALTREKRYVRADGSTIYAILSVAAERDRYGNIVRIFSQITDVTKQREDAERIRVLSNLDSLTGLCNRRAFYERGGAVLAEAPVSGEYIVLFADVNRFKTINDSLGHRTGDAFLYSIAKRIRSSMPAEAIVGRLGGDEFAIIAPGNRDDVTALIRRLDEALARPIGVHKIQLSASLSIGVALYPIHGTKLDQLLAFADMAMFQAKDKKISHAVFDGNLNGLDARWLEIEPLLRQTIETETFEYAYQYIYDIRNTEPVRAYREALVRWRFRDQVIAPNEFIPLSEETGLIRDIDRATVRCTARDWIRYPDTLVGQNVNVSALTLNDYGFVDFLDQNTVEGLIKPKATVLELTETAVLSSTGQLLELLAEVRQRGFNVAIDDFGAGQTSIGLLSKLPADFIKLDRKMTQHLGSGGVEETIVRSLIDIAHDLEMLAVCEGVEDQRQLHWLMEFGCDFAQGYLLHRPTLLHSN